MLKHKWVQEGVRRCKRLQESVLHCLHFILMNIFAASLKPCKVLLAIKNFKLHLISYYIKKANFNYHSSAQRKKVPKSNKI